MAFVRECIGMNKAARVLTWRIGKAHVEVGCDGTYGGEDDGEL